jgi:transposase
MPSESAYSDTLDRLATLLRRKPLTAREIAAHFGCCIPIAYTRIKALRAQGLAVYTMPANTPSRPGPKSLAYGVR